MVPTLGNKNWRHTQARVWLGLEKVWSRKKQSEVLFNWLKSYLPILFNKLLADEAAAAASPSSPATAEAPGPPDTQSGQPSSGHKSVGPTEPSASPDRKPSSSFRTYAQVASKSS